MNEIGIVRLKEASPETLKRIIERSRLEIEKIRRNVEEIILDVKNRGDEAIAEFYAKFYGKGVVDETSTRVLKDEVELAWRRVSEEFIGAIEVAAKNIRRFHEMQRPKDTWFLEAYSGVWIGQVARPLESVGVYVPGGRASYPSTALMTVIPAQVAGVERIVATTPPRENGTVDPHVLVALDYLGVSEIYRVGGAHAVAALTFGTKTVPRVEKIVGPGGIWFAAAKQLIKNFSDVGIDFVAGPSEILIFADGTSDPLTVAYDLISQLEHDVSAAGVVVTTDELFAEKVKSAIERLIRIVPRADIVAEALKSYSAIIVAETVEEAVEFINKYAPEHLEIQVEESSLFKVLSKIKNAGSIFLGKHSAVSLGDYIIGTNHVLPTGGLAKHRGGLSVIDYLKLIDVVYVADSRSLGALKDHIKALARVEGLPNHYKAVEHRATKA
ncbi:MAG: histidinol dehydrogenase [Desulfurococcaceae archaeon]